MVPLERPRVRTHFELVRLPGPLDVPDLDTLVHASGRECQIRDWIPLAEHDWLGVPVQTGHGPGAIHVLLKTIFWQQPNLGSAVA